MGNSWQLTRSCPLTRPLPVPPSLSQCPPASLKERMEQTPEPGESRGPDPAGRKAPVGQRGQRGLARHHPNSRQRAPRGSEQEPVLGPGSCGPPPRGADRDLGPLGEEARDTAKVLPSPCPIPRARARCGQLSAPLHGVTGTGAAKGKVGLERVGAEQEVRDVCHHCHHPSMCPGWFWPRPEGSPMPPSVQRQVGGGEVGVGSNRAIPPFIYQKSSHLETPSLGRHLWGRETSPSLVHMPGSARGEGPMVARGAFWRG